MSGPSNAPDSHLGQLKQFTTVVADTGDFEAMEEFQNASGPLARKLDPDTAKDSDIAPLKLDEPSFRYLLNDDAMATGKTAEGIRRFSADIVKLELLVQSMLD